MTTKTKKTYLEQLGLNPNIEKNEANMAERVEYLEKGIEKGKWTGILLDKAKERLMWFRRELRYLKETGALPGKSPKKEKEPKKLTVKKAPREKKTPASAPRKSRRSPKTAQETVPAASARTKKAPRASRK